MSQYREFIRDFLIGFAAAVLLCAGLYAYLKLRPSAPAVVAQPAKELRGETTATLTGKPVVVYREKVAEKLGIPKGAGHVTGSAKIPADGHQHTVTPVYDEGTGRISIFDRRDPLPWLARENRWQFNVIYGLNENADTAVRGTLLYDLIQSKRLHLGGGVSVETGGRSLIGVSVTFR